MRKENKNFFVFSLSEVEERINFNDSEQVVQVMSFQFHARINEAKEVLLSLHSLTKWHVKEVF